MRRDIAVLIGSSLILGACSGGGPGQTGGDDTGITSSNDSESDGGDSEEDSGDTDGGSGSDEGDGSDDSGSGTDGGDSSDTGQTGGDSGPIHFDLSCDEPEVGDPVLRLLTRQELDNTLSDIFPGLEGQWENSLPANRVSEAGFDNEASTVMGNQSAERLLETAESFADAVTGDALAGFLPCASSASSGADRDCAEEFVLTYGRRLFRRPLLDDEADRYLSYFDSALERSDFETAIKWVLVGMIQSPFAVYRSEVGEDMGDGTRQLTPHEIVTELAYLYTSSTPSEELLAMADEGDVDDLVAVVDELLDSERGHETVQRFFSGYLGYSSIRSIGRAGVSGFDDVNDDMFEETRAFVEAVVFDEEAGLRELLTSNRTYPSSSLASFYGMPAPSGDFTPVERPAGQGVGILAQGAFLATHASVDGSSPTKRGLFPYLRLMCQLKPPLPDDVPNLVEPEPGVKTTRERYEEIHVESGSTCSSCHRLFDPIGFAFEHFDEAGRYRETESGLEIDASGYILDSRGEELFAFDGQEELMQGLAEESVVYQCFSAYMATFAFGAAESCLAPSQAQALESGEIGIAEAFAGIAAEPHFTTRKAR